MSSGAESLQYVSSKFSEQLATLAGGLCTRGRFGTQAEQFDDLVSRFDALLTQNTDGDPSSRHVSFVVAMNGDSSKPARVSKTHFSAEGWRQIPALVRVDFLNGQTGESDGFQEAFRHSNTLAVEAKRMRQHMDEIEHSPVVAY